ncbi:hypothetical protein CC1G_08589 [Coprinopsis cinerea okayama7|uniref:DUF4470 domain-containing protein n=1 Tax=Coprinopsis cinerea (strain Okayama-7 / 130 / ATCC MYA-4618 / FGSC 9003) TaxID=240176 RepID=A8NCV8_COPC7|nr:hypothetical protein CC1G_08589 [Coprinopsis cinerea okayama7\|eukprot:XP_001832639.2 hypothetical protein CC1G_08589 [Coprinopsis cinerea okayama7\
MRASDWEPCWLREGRAPTFMNNSTTPETLSRSDPNYGKSMAVGLALWGNTPAVDALNLPRNENNSHRDYSVAFPASGDLRHVVRTINKLPDDFSGNINILLNDGCLNVALRNLVLLLILGTAEDEALGVDIATHFWYSTFMPIEYNLHITLAITRFVSHLDSRSEGKGEIGFKLGLRSAVDGAAILSAPGAVELLRHFSSANFDIEDAQKECDRVKHDPSRRDYRDRYYLRLKPSHRVAYQEFRRFGLLLPFGAPNHHFNHPNSSLFSKEGKWVQSDFAEPLNGWEVDEVLATGKQHGATPEDIYGCLYFYVSEQLRLFTERLSKFCIRFTLLPMEACMLGNSLQMKSGEQGESSSKGRMTNFDRIIFSNIVDENYVGIRKALTSWAPLLSKSKWATIVAYFMNWPFIQRNGRVRDAGEAVLERVSGEYSLKLQLDSSASLILKIKYTLKCFRHYP